MAQATNNQSENAPTRPGKMEMLNGMTIGALEGGVLGAGAWLLCFAAIGPALAGLTMCLTFMAIAAGIGALHEGNKVSHRPAARANEKSAMQSIEDRLLGPQKAPARTPEEEAEIQSYAQSRVTEQSSSGRRRREPHPRERRRPETEEQHHGLFR